MRRKSPRKDEGVMPPESCRFAEPLPDERVEIRRYDQRKSSGSLELNQI